MRRSWGAGVVLGVAAIVALAVGCGDEVAKPTGVTRAVAVAPGAARVEGEGAAVKESARAKFHRVNRLDFVGVAHNAAVRQFMARVQRGEVHGSVCDEILTAVSQTAALPSGGQATAAQKRATARRVLTSMGTCATSGPARVHEAALMQSSGELSPGATALISGIDLAISSSATSQDLAAALLPILDQAAQLSPVEADIVAAGASVALASHENWETTVTDAYISSVTDGIVASYGDCFQYYSTADEGVSSCMGLHQSRLALPTSYRGGGTAGPVFQLAGFYTCPKPDPKEVIHTDFAGAIGGAIVTAWTGGGVIIGAFVAGTGASVGEMAWQLGVGGWCHAAAALKGSQIMPT